MVCTRPGSQTYGLFPCRLPTSRSAPAVPNWAQFASVSSALSARQIPNQVLPVSESFASPFTLAVPLASPLQTSAASLLAYPSTLLNAIDHPAPTSAATSQPNLTLPQNSDTQLAQPSQPSPSLPLYTADTYGFMKGSFGQLSSWPQIPLTAVNSSSSGSVPARPLSEAGPPAAASDAAQSWQCGRPEGVDSVSDDGSSVESDPAAVVEDALLGELFFQQLQVQQQARAAPAHGQCSKCLALYRCYSFRPAMHQHSISLIQQSCHQTIPNAASLPCQVILRLLQSIIH